jgi:carbamoyltransferase
LQIKFMNILGISAGFHDAAATVINRQGDILFAGHSERYSKKKNDADFCQGLLDDISEYGPDVVAYYERPWAKQLRRLRSGEGIEWNKLTVNQILKSQLGNQIDIERVYSFNHHLSHAAAGFQTSTFDRATVVVIDAIGESDTVSIYGAEYDLQGHARYKRLWGQQYPHSIGLFYSAMTKRAGLIPNEEEYILMGMAAYGKPYATKALTKRDLIDDDYNITFKENLHIGTNENFLLGYDDVDIAAGAQSLVEDLIKNVMRRAQAFGWSKNLVYMGGVALNCSVNRKLGNYFDNIWIMPNPGDAGSSLGAAALVHSRRLNWTSAYLGHNIPGSYPVNNILDCLLSDRIVGVASGRAEFGPRALGNRSLLADPRGTEIKDKVNEIKRRQKFRPFAPVIMEEHVDQYFDMPSNWRDSRYMQVVGRCRRPDLFPAIVHHDGSSRIQTVSADGSGIRELLEKWFVMTDCPMLLNTSLNIRGEPMVNDRADADRFERLYGVKVLS